MLYLTNTLTGKKELFTSHTAHTITLYVCGITPYSPAHIGHGRCYVSFDVLVRLFLYYGYTIKYCRNFTDVDDKLLHKAHERYGDSNRYLEIAQENIILYHHDMSSLNCTAPTYEPRVTQSIDIIITYIEQLIAAGKAYQKEGSVYFRVKLFNDYGKLSKQNIDDLRTGVRMHVRDEKEDALDFVLWKKELEGVNWHSPWGPGRPGWHIECSAMARAYLGDHLDIHAGGLDLIFPHHENEIAQSESLLQYDFARYWLHNGLVTINQEKMAKSIGNVFLLQDIHKKCDPILLRYYIIMHHYRSPLEFSWESMHTAQKAYNRLVNAFSKVMPQKIVQENRHRYSIVAAVLDALYDDLNTPALLGIVFESLIQLAEDTVQAAAIKDILVNVLGLPLVPLIMPSIEITPEIHHLIAERQKARDAKDWVLADTLRDQLKEQYGYEVQDKKVH